MPRLNLILFSTLIRIVLFSALLVNQPSLVYANTLEVDSLLAILNGEIPSEEKGEILLKLSKSLQGSDIESSFEYANKAYDWSIEMADKNIEGQSLKSIGTLKLLKWELDEGLDYLFRAIELIEQHGTKEQLQGCLNTIGSAYYRKGDNMVAMEYFDRAINTLEKDSQNELTAGILGNIANIHFAEGDLEKALKYSHQALELNREINNLNGITSTLINLGSQYSKKKSYDKAIKYYEEALEIARSNKNKRLEVLVLMNLGNRYSAKEDFNLAMSYLEKALVISDELEDSGQKGKTLYNIASLQRKLKNYDQAISYGKQSLELSSKVGNKKWVLHSYKLLVECYKSKEDFKKALEFKSLYHTLQDSVYNIEKSEKISEISTRYETKEKEIENQRLKDEQLKNEAIIHQQKTIGLLIGLILLLTLTVLGVLYKNYKNKSKYSENLVKEVASRTADLEKSNLQLKVSNMELERFAYITSHDLKEPLRNIMSFTGLLDRNLPEEVRTQKNISQYTEFILNNTKQLNFLIEDVLEYSRIGTSEPEIKMEYLKDVLNSVLSSISEAINKKNVEVKIGDLPLVQVEQTNLFQVFKCLIVNGIKYNENPKPIISIEGKLTNGICQISVTDNGIGIEEKYQDQIFEMFKRLHDKRKHGGSGLGLAICKKILTRMNGDIFVKSKLGEGSTFTFSFQTSEEV